MIISHQSCPASMMFGRKLGDFSCREQKSPSHEGPRRRKTPGSGGRFGVDGKAIHRSTRKVRRKNESKKAALEQIPLEVESQSFMAPDHGSNVQSVNVFGSRNWPALLAGNNPNGVPKKHIIHSRGRRGGVRGEARVRSSQNLIPHCCVQASRNHHHQFLQHLCFIRGLCYVADCRACPIASFAPPAAPRVQNEGRQSWSGVAFMLGNFSAAEQDRGISTARERGGIDQANIHTMLLDH